MNLDKGIKLALITALVSGISVFINKFAVGVIQPPLVFTTVKNLGVGLLILSLVLGRGKLETIKKLNKGQLTKLLGVALIGGTLPFYLFFTGLSQTAAINGAIIHKTLVFWASIFAVIFLKEKLTKKHGVAILLLFGSNLFVGGFEGFRFNLGELYILIATLLWSMENIIAKKVLVTVDSDILTLFRMGGGSLILLGTSIITQPQGLALIFSLSLTQAFWLFATMGTLLMYVSTWYSALKNSTVINVSTALSAGALVTNVLTSMFITGNWNVAYIPQGLMVAAGMYILIIAQKRSDILTIQSK